MPTTLAERAVIGAVVTMDAPWPTQVVELDAHDFASHDNAEIWDSIGAVRERGEPVDIVHVYREIRNEHSADLGIRMMEFAEDSPMSGNVDHWAGLIIDASRKRSAENAVSEALRRVEGSATADETITAINDAMRSVRQATSKDGPKLAKSSLMGVLDDLAREREDPNHARIASSGLPRLDEEFEMRAGHLTILAGRPGMGKSALAGNIAAHTSREDDGKSVALFSLEMDTASLIRRIMSGEARLRTPLVDAVGSDALDNACQRILHMRLYIDDRAGLSVDAMSAALCKVPNVKLVVVDYLQLAKMNAKLERQDLRVGAITKQLKNMAKDHNCHVLGLSQLSRAVEQRGGDKRPMLSDLRDSGNIEEDADNVVFVYRQGYYDPNADQDEAELIISKQRHGRPGVVKARWMPTAQRFLPWS